MKKTLLLLSLLAAPALAANYDIGTLEELREFMEAVHVEDFAGDTITLTADIDCEGGRFNTGDPEYPSTFRGTFDGGGHVISNFVHAATGSTQEGFGVAMFDLAETGAAIQNLTLEGSLPGTASGAYAAPFVLAVESPLGLFLDNCHFRGGVTNYYHAAGLVGFASSGTGAMEVPSVVLTNCSVRGEIVSTWIHTAGGLVAKGTGVQAFDCSVESELHGGRTGGLVGEAYGGSFEGCSFEGTMRPDRETVGNCIQGGLSAETSNTVFRACTSAVGLDSRAAAAGGAVGVTHGSSAFHDCSATVKASNVSGNQNTLGLAGFAASVGSGGLISNCLVKVDWQGVHPDSYVGSALESCQYYGLAHTVSGACIRIVDCTVEGRLAGGTRACGFVGSATLNGGEIARCAVFADVSTLTNRTDGMAAGFAGSLSLSGGAVVRECFSAGTVDAAGDAAGFACEIDLRDDESQVRDCYSTAEVVGGENQNPAGFACRISDSNDEGGVLPVANCWFGGTVRVRGRTSSDYQPYGFAYSLEGDASLENCAWVAVDGVKEAGTAGATALSQAASRKAASWPGYDFARTWSISEDETTPYFAWSLSEGTDFRLFAVQEEGKTVTIGESAAPGAEAAVSAVAEDSDLIFCGWTGGASYTNAAVNPSALLADNHRTARCVWGKAITTRAELAAITNDLTGTYGLAADIDLAGENWTPIGNSDYTAFSGTIYGQGHVISNMVVDTDGAVCAGLFGYLSGATITDLALANPVVRGADCVGALAGYADGLTAISGCTVEGADVEATSERAGCFAGQIEGGATVTRCSATGSIAGSGRYVGGFVGSAADSTAFEKCFALAEVSGAGEGTGGFVGYAEDSPTFSECFACGGVDSTGTGAGGFAGYLSGSPAVSDCYALEDVKGGNYVGGFAGHFYYCDGAFERCYAAGTETSPGETGGFVGRQYRGSPTFADCFRIDDGLADIGAEDVAGIDALDAAGMRSTGNFEAFLETDKWTQADGLTQPYFAWSLADGKMTLGGKIAGTGAGSIEGTGSYAPGETVTIRAESADGFFVAWTGSTPYADPSSPTTTIALDNHRVAAVQFGKYVRTAADLQSVTNDLAGLYGLDADIDLAGIDWKPIGNNATKFTGKFYGFGHSVSNLVCTNNPNSECKGLFGATDGAVLDGITVSGTVQCNAYYYYAGGLVGHATATLVTNCHATAEVEAGRYAGGLVGYVGNGTTILGCSAAGSVKATGNYAYAGGLVGGSDGGTFEIRDCVSSAEVTATAAYVGGFIGYVTGSGASVISGCRADGYAGGHGSVGGFVGYVNSPMTITDCVARGDVRSTGSYYGGFVGYFYNNAATIEDCWCSGAVWGTGGTIGSFVGYLRGNGTIEDCSIYAFGAGPRPFCGSDATFEGGSLSAARIEELTRDWPEVKQHVDGATPISTAEELLAVTNDLAGIYVLTADIDFEGAAIEPIGMSTAFSGEFYGQNHKIKNFVIDSTAQYVGLFGRINGGRVSGVVAEGSVRGAYAAAGSSTGTGGFAGLIGSQSLVDGCSFEGAVVNATTYNVGGFVGRTEGAPVILRSSYSGLVVQQANGCTDAGGFAGDHGGGYVMDCYAIADVEAGNNRYAAGFAGNANGRITTSWCAASVEGTGNNRGAFAGYAQTDYITDSYYDSGKTDLNAVGNAAVYDGISALATDDMLHEASFAGFDFVATWNIDEGATTPYLRAFLVQRTAFAAWLEDELNLPPDTDPLTVVNGVPLLARYVYGILPLTGQTDADGNPLVDFKMNANGPVFELASQKNEDEYGMQFSVLWSPNLADDWRLDPGDEWPLEIRFDQDGDGNDATCHPPVDPDIAPQMFFKYKIVIED